MCLELGRFIEQIGDMVSEKDPFIMTLNREKLTVHKIVYPDLDPYKDKGEWEDLLPKRAIPVKNYPEEKKKNPINLRAKIL